MTLDRWLWNWRLLIDDSRWRILSDAVKQSRPSRPGQSWSQYETSKCLLDALTSTDEGFSRIAALLTSRLRTNSSTGSSENSTPTGCGQGRWGWWWWWWWWWGDNRKSAKSKIFNLAKAKNFLSSDASVLFKKWFQPKCVMRLTTASYLFNFLLTKIFFS